MTLKKYWKNQKEKFLTKRKNQKMLYAVTVMEVEG